MSKLNISLNLPVSFLKEGSRYVAYTPALDLSTSGDTLEQARRRFTEAVESFFEETLDKGTLDQALSDLGWQKTRNRWNPPVVVSHDTEEIRV